MEDETRCSLAETWKYIVLKHEFLAKTFFNQLRDTREGKQEAEHRLLHLKEEEE